MSVYIKQKHISSSFESKEPWIIFEEIETKIKDKIVKIGKQLQYWNINVNYGIKTGFNDAFIINEKIKNELISEDPKSAEIIRPILRGRNINRFGYKDSKEFLIVSHNGDKNRNIPKIDIDNYKAIKKFMDGFGDRLFKRTDQGDTPYNLRNCTYMDDFLVQKLVWTPVNSEYRFALVPKDIYFNNSLFMIVGEKIELLCGLANSLLYQFYFKLMLSSGEYNYGAADFFKQIPFAYFENESTKQIIELVKMLANRYDENLFLKLNELVFKIYNISYDEIKYINFYLKN